MPEPVSISFAVGEIARRRTKKRPCCKVELVEEIGSIIAIDVCPIARYLEPFAGKLGDDDVVAPFKLGARDDEEGRVSTDEVRLFVGGEVVIVDGEVVWCRDRSYDAHSTTSQSDPIERE